MIIPESAERHFSKKNNHKEYELFQRFPIAFFGSLLPYPKQAAIIKYYLENEPKVCVITGWKRTGKTQIGAYLTAAWMLSELDPRWPGARAMKIDSKRIYRWKKRINNNRICLIGGSSMDHINSVLLKQYQELLPPSYVKSWFSNSNHRITLTEGTTAVVRSYDQKLIEWKSGAYGRAHLDEEPPYDKLMEVMDRLRTTEGKLVITVAVDDADVSYLPEACLNPLKFFGTNSFMHVKLGVEDVPDQVIPASEKKIVFQQYDGGPFEKAVRKGEFAFASGRWWPEFEPKIHIIKPFKIPDNWKRWRFIDAGTAAPTACLWIALHPNNIMFVYREYYKKMTTIGERCKDIIEMSGNRRERESGIWIERETEEKYEMTELDHAEFRTDAITGDGLDFEYIKEGLVVQPWTTLGQEARRDVVRKWLWVDKREKHFITHEPGAPRVYIFDECANLIWEAQKKTFKMASSDRAATNERKIQNKDDHAMDCLESAACELRWIIDGRDTHA